MKHLRIAAVSIGLTAYMVAFYATSLPSVLGDTGRPLLRIELLWQLLWLPDQFLIPNWFGIPPGFSFLDRLPVLLTAGAILAWATVLGWLLCRAVRLPSLSRWETFVFSAAVGLNAVSTWVLLLGLFGVMDRLWMFIIPALLTLTAACVLLKKTQPFAASQWLPAQVAFHAPYGRWLWLAVPFVLMILLAAMLPPLDFDVREYHLQAPKEFFEQGQITFLPYNVYANMAMGTEMLSLLAMVLTGDWWLGALAGKTIIAVFTLLTALGLLAAGRRLFSPAAGVVAALVYLSIPWVVSIASGGFVEGASACYLFLAVYALLLHREHGTMSFLVLAGYLAGAAVATKYPAALFVLLPLAAWVLVKPRPVVTLSNATAGRGFTWGVFLLAAAVGCGLWFGKNWGLSGNPTYPLLYEVFDGRSWDIQKQQQWNQAHRPHDFSAKTLGKDLGRVALTSEWLSPLVMPLAFLAFFGRGRRFGIRWGLLAYVAFVIVAWWLLTHRIDRFWIPMLPIVSLLAGAGACWTADRWWRRLMTVLLAVGLGANFLVASAGQGNAWFVSLTRLRNEPGWISPWHQYFNNHVVDGRLLTVGDAAVFDLTVPVLYNTCFDDCIFEQLVKGKTPQEIRTGLESHGIAYIYVDWSEIVRYRHTYGFTEYIQPEIFDQLVAEGILEPLPPIEGSSGRGYRVKCRNEERRDIDPHSSFFVPSFPCASTAFFLSQLVLSTGY